MKTLLREPRNPADNTTVPVSSIPSAPLATTVRAQPPGAQPADAQHLAVQPPSMPLKQRALFFRQFATCVKSGLSLGMALAHLSQAATHPELREAARKARICVEGGGKLSAWMKTRPAVFSRAECALVLVGETGGAIDAMLDRIATDLENEVALHRKLFAATFMAKYVLLPLLLLVPGMGNIMINGLNGLEKKGGAGLSERAQQQIILVEGLKGFGHELLQRLLPLALVAVLLCLAFRFACLTAPGRRMRDRLTLMLPGIGPLWRDLAISRYLTALSLLTRAGLTTPAALEACEGIAGNIVLDEKMTAAARLARDTNAPIDQALRSTGLLSGTSLSLIGTGQFSGSAPAMLEQSAAYYKQDVQSRMTSVPKIVGLICLTATGIATAIVVGSAFKLYYENVFIGVDKFMGMN